MSAIVSAMFSFAFLYVVGIHFYLVAGQSNPNCECGRQYLGTRIVGGRNAAPNAYPWQVALVSGQGVQFCGGVLINSQWILTAAHCLLNLSPSNVFVVLGTSDLDAVYPDLVIGARRLVLHYLYSSAPDYFYDIALVELQRQVQFSNRVLPICLPKPGPRYFGPLIITGWGRLTYMGSQPRKLQEAAVMQKNDAYCRQVYGPKYTSNHICANDRGKDICSGDSGGPLLARSGGKVFSVGIVSWGIVCGDYNYPGVFTRTSDYIEWIMTNANTGFYCPR